jgi:hypothetical protein
MAEQQFRPLLLWPPTRPLGLAALGFQLVEPIVDLCDCREDRLSGLFEVGVVFSLEAVCPRWITTLVTAAVKSEIREMPIIISIAPTTFPVLVVGTTSP